MVVRGWSGGCVVVGGVPCSPPCCLSLLVAINAKTQRGSRQRERGKEREREGEDRVEDGWVGRVVGDNVAL